MHAIAATFSSCAKPWMMYMGASAGAFAEQVLVRENAEGSQRPQIVQGVVLRPQRPPGQQAGADSEEAALRITLRCKRVVCSAGALHTPALLLRWAIFNYQHCKLQENAACADICM